MKHTGTVVRIQRSRTGVMLIVDIGMGLRGVELDRELWDEVLRDFGRTQDGDLTGWVVEYDPEYGDLEVTGPATADHASDEDRDRPEQA